MVFFKYYEENYEYDKAFQLTKEAMLKENVVIYEAAFQFDGLFIRTDIIVKILSN
jgi:hypothetical protein